MIVSGIYQIRNSINHKMYVGSAKSIRHRFNSHRSSLSRGIHHSSLLQNAWNKYGVNSFVFEILEETENLIEREQFWIDQTKCYIKENGYNTKRIANSNLGVYPSLETRMKMSASRKGKKFSEETRMKQSISAKNREKLSELTRKKISDSHKGKKKHRLRLKLIHIDTMEERIVTDIQECLTMLNISESKRTTIYAVTKGIKDSINGYKIINLRND